MQLSAVDSCLQTIERGDPATPSKSLVSLSNIYLSDGVDYQAPLITLKKPSIAHLRLDDATRIVTAAMKMTGVLRDSVKRCKFVLKIISVAKIATRFQLGQVSASETQGLLNELESTIFSPQFIHKCHSVENLHALLTYLNGLQRSLKAISDPACKPQALFLSTLIQFIRAPRDLFCSEGYHGPAALFMRYSALLQGFCSGWLGVDQIASFCAFCRYWPLSVAKKEEHPCRKNAS